MEDSFEQLVADLASDDIGSTFNFLRDEDSGLDVDGGAAIRSENLLRYLEERSRATILGLGEAAGYAGARWSGIAFTSERTLVSWGAPYVTTHGPPKVWTEQAATIVHDVLEQLDVEDDVLLWNTVPMHPRRPGVELSNRTPLVAERAHGATYARRLVALVKPKVVVAIGRLAQGAVPNARYVRHPSNGGKAEFAEGMRRIVDELRASGHLPPSHNGAS